MQLPAPLLRRNRYSHKNDFGHVLVVAGSSHMLGAAALTALSAMRAGAGLVTVAVPKSLNLTLQKKISSVVMTWPLDETKEGSLSFKAFGKIEKEYKKFNAIALGPGLSMEPSTQKLILKIIETSPVSLIIDADGLNALCGHLSVLNKSSTPKVLTPHSGELARLIKKNRKEIESSREETVREFIKKYKTVLLLKGHRTIVATQGQKIYTNKTGNVGMATAGSGDVLTGIIAAFLAQGAKAFQAACVGAFIHGKTGDLASREKSKTSLISSDIIDMLPRCFKDKE